MSGTPGARPSAGGEPQGSGLTWTVGAVASRTGLPASTLRTWERRYGIGPTERTAGGHRRYSELDIARVELLNRLIGRGVSAREAAAVAVDFDGRDAPRRADDSDITALVHEPAAMVGAVVDAARGHDGDRVSTILSAAIGTHDIVTAWDEYLAPTLVRIGEEWARGTVDVSAEHLVSERLSVELRAYVHRRADLDRSRGTVLLASAEDDPHALPVVALQAALADHAVSCHSLGARLPADALAKVVETIHPEVIFVWASLPRPRSDRLWQVVTSVPEATTVVVGGPGWPLELSQDDGQNQPVRTGDLSSTVDLIVGSLGQARLSN